MTCSSSPGFGQSNHQSQPKVVGMFAEEIIGRATTLSSIVRSCVRCVPPLGMNAFILSPPWKVVSPSEAAAIPAFTASCLHFLCQHHIANVLLQSKVNAGVRCILKVNGIQSHETQKGQVLSPLHVHIQMVYAHSLKYYSICGLTEFSNLL